MGCKGEGDIGLDIAHSTIPMSECTQGGEREKHLRKSEKVETVIFGELKEQRQSEERDL